MLQNSILVFQQICVMGILMFFGFIVYKQGIVDNQFSKQLSNFVNKYVTPFAIILSFNRVFDINLANSLVWLAVMGAVILVISAVLVRFIYTPDKPHAPNSQLCTLLPNNGFMALPLVNAMYGSDGVALASVGIVVTAILVWTYGVRILSPDYRFTYKALLFNPGVLAAIGGLLLFISPVKLPALLYEGLSYIGGLNTPLGMMILGIYLAQVDLRSCFTRLDCWHTTMIRLVLLPAIVVVIAALLPIDEAAKYVLVISFSTPCAVTSATFAQIYDTDYLFAARTVALSTILSLLTLPFAVAVLGIILHFMG